MQGRCRLLNKKCILKPEYTGRICLDSRYWCAKSYSARKKTTQAEDTRTSKNERCVVQHSDILPFEYSNEYFSSETLPVPKHIRIAFTLQANSFPFWAAISRYIESNLRIDTIFPDTAPDTIWQRGGRTRRGSRRPRWRHGWTSTRRILIRPRARRSCLRSLRRWHWRRYPLGSRTRGGVWKKRTKWPGSRKTKPTMTMTRFSRTRRITRRRTISRVTIKATGSERRRGEASRKMVSFLVILTRYIIILWIFEKCRFWKRHYRYMHFLRRHKKQNSRIYTYKIDEIFKVIKRRDRSYSIIFQRYLFVTRFFNSNKLTCLFLHRPM